MSRGGRGGFRGGRLKGGRPEWEIGQVLDSKPSELFPPYNIPTATPPTDKETREIEYYLKLRDQIHQSTMHTNSSTQNTLTKTYGEDQFNNQYHHRSKTDIDPFLGVPTYSEKYEPKARTIPQIMGSFNKELFPKELWSTLEGKDGEAVRAGVNRGMKRKAAFLADPDPISRLTGKDRAQSVMDKLDKLKDLGEDADADSEVGDEDKPPEEEHDYDYEEDEDEMGGDYNAENYFDGGEEEDDDGGDGGDGEY